MSRHNRRRKNTNIKTSFKTEKKTKDYADKKIYCYDLAYLKMEKIIGIK